MSDSVVILGRQPQLGLAELERLYGADSLQPLSDGLAILKVDPAEVNFSRLGGTVKLARLLTRIDSVEWPAIVDYLVQEMPKHTCCVIPGKIRLGLNVYGLAVTKKDLERAGLTVKKAVRDGGRSVRLVPNVGLVLNSAQTIHNQLTGPTGFELVLIKDGAQTILAQVCNVQNITAYARRDQARPKRDAHVGMLPPKLAQIIINLAGNHASAMPLAERQKLKSTGQRSVLLDPFCGTGVILQEGLLMGYDVYGTDLEPRMVEYSTANLEWLHAPGEYTLETGDATSVEWSQKFNIVATETYLGRAFSSPPSPATLKQVISDVNLIHKRFLENLAAQAPSGTTICLAVPAWKTGRDFTRLPCVAENLDSLERLGYTRMSFAHVRREDLIYHREGQIVARELVILQRN